MEIILREDFLQLGYIGDKVRVRSGFARNFLIPRGIAVEASGRNNRMLQHQLSGIIAKRMKRKAEAEAFGKTLSDVTVEFTLKIGQGGKSFGSVTARDVEAKLKDLGYTVDRKQIRLVEVIKGAGTYQVDIKLHSEVTVPVQLKVIAEKIVVEADSAKGEKKGGRGRRKKDQADAEAPAADTTEAAAVEE